MTEEANPGGVSAKLMRPASRSVLRKRAEPVERV
jgi:hypothetical protein